MSNLYDVARKVTDEVLGEGTYAAINKDNPDPQVQAAIDRVTSHTHNDVENRINPAGRTILKANPGKYRVIGVDTFEAPAGADWVYAEWDTLEEAIFCANLHGASMNVTHVYDDQGRHLYQAGTF